MPLTSNQALGELQLVWSDDSQRVAYYDETTQTRPPRVFFRSGSSLNETALPELLPPKLPASAASGDAETKEKLKQSQRAWLAFRDAEAAFSADQARGGSMVPTLRYETMTELTQQRIKQLTARLTD
jgi:Lysozyme inhibitor LprI